MGALANCAVKHREFVPPIIVFPCTPVIVFPVHRQLFSPGITGNCLPGTTGNCRKNFPIHGDLEVALLFLLLLKMGDVAIRDTWRRCLPPPDLVREKAMGFGLASEEPQNLSSLNLAGAAKNQSRWSTQVIYCLWFYFLISLYE